MVLLNMLMEIALPKMGALLVMMTMISPSRTEVPLAELLRPRAKAPAQVPTQDGGASS